MRKSVTAVLAVAALALGLVLGIFGGQQAGWSASTTKQHVPTSPISPGIEPTAKVSLHTLQPVSPSLPPHSGNAGLLLRAVEVLDALKARDFAALSALVSPEGLTFTPLSTVNLEADLTFTKKEVARFSTDSKRYIWGLFSGTAAPIELTPAAYFDKYVFNADYTTAPNIGVDEVIAAGNALENVQEAYPDATFVEFHFPGIDPAKEGFDWCSLKLVFHQNGKEYLLVGLIHSEWTA